MEGKPTTTLTLMSTVWHSSRNLHGAGTGVECFTPPGRGEISGRKVRLNSVDDKSRGGEGKVRNTFSKTSIFLHEE